MRDRREQGVKESLPNPSTRYYTWKGTKDAFVYYDKEEGVEKKAPKVSVALFLLVNEVSGYHKKTKSGLWSNAVSEFGVGKEELVVYSSKPDKNNNTLIAKGIWKQIKGDVKAAGGHFTRVLYAYEFGVGIVKISLTGTAMESFNDFYKVKGVRNEVLDKLLEVKSTTKKDEDDDYSIPVFSLGKKFTEKQDQELQQAYNTLMDYIESKNASKGGDDDSDQEQGSDFIDEAEPMKEPVGEDSLPF